jgi:hypothetical protein
MYKFTSEELDTDRGNQFWISPIGRIGISPEFHRNIDLALQRDGVHNAVFNIITV